MEFRVLGPLQVVRDGVEVPVTAARQRPLLAALALHADRLVAADQLIDRVWGVEPPAGARGTLRTYVMRLRKTLGDASLIETMPNGYRLVGALTDVQRFDSLVQTARVTPADAALPLLDQALALWRGSPADGLLPAEAQTLEERRLEALTRRCELAVELGRQKEAIPELRRLVDEHPLRENLWALFIRALHRAGRQTEALAAYDKARATLADELGIDPGAELRALHDLMTGSLPRRVASQLPPSVGNFVGRRRELDALREHLAAHRVAVVCGPPGIGKTTLAVRAAHELKAEFPDGQLFVNLRGYDLRQPLATTQVLAMFLRALGVPADQIPPEEDELIQRYRAECAGRRLLVVLDNASTSGQIRPLLLDEPTAVHLVTSRDTLDDLARPLRLDVLPADDSLALLGPEITAAAPDAAAEVTELCGHLPLALRIVVGNLADHSAQAVADYAAELRGRRRIDALEIVGEEKAGVRTTFDMSYAALDGPTRRLFRLLSVIPGPDFTAALAAAVTDLPDVAAHLGRLASTNLLHEHAPGRFQFHDLIRAYAAERCLSDDTPPAVDAATARMLDHYLHTIDNATVHMGRDAPRLSCPPPPPESRPVTFEDARAAGRWLAAELPNIMSAMEFATGFRSGWHGWQLTNALHYYFLTTVGPQHDWPIASRLGLAAAERDGDVAARAEMHRAVAISLRPWMNAGWDVDDLGAQALSHLAESIALYREAGDGYGIPNTISNYAIVLHDLGRTTEAIGYFTEAIAAAVEHRSEHAEITGRSNLAVAYGEVGRLADAEAIHLSTLDAARRIGHRATETRILMCLGDISHLRGDFTAAQEWLRQALELAAELSLDSMRHNIQALAIWTRAVRSRSLAEDDRTALVRIARTVNSIDALSAAAAAYLDGGDHDCARAMLENFVGHMRKRTPQYCDGHMLSYLAEVFLDEGKLDDAAAVANDALTVSRAISSRVYEGRSLTTLAGVEMRRGDRQAAARLASEALAVHRETGHRPGEADTLALLGELGDDQRRAEAAALYAEMAIMPRRG